MCETLPLYPHLCSLRRENWGTEGPSSCLEPAAKDQASYTCWMWTLGLQVSAPWPASELWEQELAGVLAGVVCKPPSLWSTQAPLPPPPSAPVSLSWPNSQHHCDLLRCSEPWSQLAGSPSGAVAVGVTSSRDDQPQGARMPGLAQCSPDTEQVLSQVRADE